MAEQSRKPYSSLPEVVDAIPTRVEGMIPSWVNGSLIRVGPGLFEFGQNEAVYPMDGMGLVHAFHIQDGQAKYQSRLINSETYKRNVAADRFVVAEFGTPPSPDPKQSFFGKLKNITGGGDISDNGNHNLFYWKETKSLLVAGNPMYIIEPSTLETKDKVKLPDKLGVDIITEHVHIDKDGTLYILGSHVKGKPKYHIVKVPVKENVEASFAAAEIVGSVDGQFKMTPTSHHTFLMTENYFVVIECPLEINIMKILTKGTILEALQWESKVTCKFHVLKKKDGRALKLKMESDSMHLLHSSNAYEDGDYIIFDGFIFNKLNSIGDLFTPRKGLAAADKKESWRNLDVGKSVRYVIPINEEKIAGKQSGEKLVDLPGEDAQAIMHSKTPIRLQHRPLTATREDVEHLQYPNINPALATKDYTYFYAGGYGESDFLKFGIGKYNVKTKEVSAWEAKDQQYLSEPLFIADPQGTEEDDGVLLFTMLDYSESNDRLVVVDAKSMTTLAQVYIEEQGSGRVLLPEADHGTFVPST